MELMDFSVKDEELRESKLETRSPLGIDLNEIPTSTFCLNETLPDYYEHEPESIEVVRSIHDNPDPAPGAPASVPRGGMAVACGTCGRLESWEPVVVCDGCERGFHLGCAGIGGLHAASLADWVCRECLSGGVRSKRWPLGMKSKRILDINASPPSDGDGDWTEEVQDLRKHTCGDNSFACDTHGVSLISSNLLSTGNRFGCQKASGTVTCKIGVEDSLGKHVGDRSLEALGLEVPLETIKGENNTSIRCSSRDQGEVFLQSLKEFITKRHGVLEDGWHVELKYLFNSYGFYPLYCSPDGKTFGSVEDVACYLGLMSNPIIGFMDTDIRTDGSHLHERLHLPKKRKPKRFPTNGRCENKESLQNGLCKALPSSGQNMGNCASKSGDAVKTKEDETAWDGSHESEVTNDALPVQFEDFMVLHLGRVDSRPSYHDVNLIYPLGYRSCWHDKLTGSFFRCEVSDGGVSGPVFKVKRFSCSSLLIPCGSPVIVRPNIGSSPHQDNNFKYHEWNNNVSIQMIFSDPCPPTENDILNCVDNGPTQMVGFDRLVGSDGYTLSNNLELRDEIGEISVEGCSPSDAWRKMSQKIVFVFSDICKQKGKPIIFCKHAENITLEWDMVDEKDKTNFAPLLKFCSSQAPLFPSRGDNFETDTLAEMLSKWLEEDRFGLDVDFVQEMIEQLPGVEACLSYEFLKNRSSYLTSVRVGSGLLIVERTGEKDVKEEIVDGLFGKSKKPRLVGDSVVDTCPPPPGKPLSLRLPPELAGDFHQVLELFWRFHELLDLKDPFNAEKFEEELINPWSNGSNDSENEIRGSEVLGLHGIDDIDRQVLSSCKGSHLLDPKEHPDTFIQMETEAMKDAAETKLASMTYSRCFGMILRKAHISLLQVLSCELQSKVAALVDPNFDSGELRSRRGRKKDIDISLPVKRTKLNMLPINDLTWPEIARRYLLSVLSMDGNLESADVIARESGKVFRCLQGDGGVLCGSLTGVAGMEADAFLLAEATKKIFGSLNSENTSLSIEDEESDVSNACEKDEADNDTPKWANLLEPVRKLPTNVGTRIRKCVNEALANSPPEWARRILEHSISKEVYKGNASGPTKKAVLAVLADLKNQTSVRKSEKANKKKILVHLSNIIMNQCRAALRGAVAVDESKVFCNLLGRKLMNSNDNDEGLLGSPAMVSRPLDFRTIDLRLAAGAYDRSLEAFLEDFWELCNNVRVAFADQPSSVELVETLSQKFASLYEEKVITFAQRFVDYSKLECPNAEDRKEINDFLASMSEIPEAPWEEGVCKVCGLDKDDDSVLLCDSCDAEYHKYCLSPPLVSIPDGNWYCPSCVAGKRVVQDASECSKVSGLHRGKKYHGVISQAYLETLAHVSAAMDVKEYWELSVDERTFLIKFLCDELLNSTLVHHHLEQCTETTAELQQKLRSLSVEWKNLKAREEFLATRVAKCDTNMAHSAGETGRKDGFASGVMDHGKCMGQPCNSSDVLNAQTGSQEEIYVNGFTKQHLASYSEKMITLKTQHRSRLNSGSQSGDGHAVVDDNEAPSPRTKKVCSTGKFQENGNDVVSLLTKPSDDQGFCLPSNTISSHGDQNGPSLAANELQAYQVDLSTIKNDILILQNSIDCLESEILKLSVRKEFLGTDSIGRLYWLSAMPSGDPYIIVDGSSAIKQRIQMLSYEDQMGSRSGFQSYTPHNDIGDRKTRPSFLREVNNSKTTCSPWVSYQSDAEIKELVGWLKDNDPKERELKESILNLKKLKLLYSRQASNQAEKQNQTASSAPANEHAASSDCLVTKAALFLEKCYGPFFEFETGTSKMQEKKARRNNEDKMYRCECLEPIWPARSHCFSCHRTFSTDAQFREHSDGRCSPSPLASERIKEYSDGFKGKNILKSNIPQTECNIDKDAIDITKNNCSDLSSKLIKFQNEGLACPYNFEEICSRFLTNDSNQELVQQIGLIGSNGAPSFIPSISPYYSDSVLSVSLKNKAGILGDHVRGAERLTFSQGGYDVGGAVHEVLSDKPYIRSAAKDASKVLVANRPVLGCTEPSDKKSLASPLDCVIGSCCVIPQTSLRPLVGKVSHIARRLKINLLDADAALPEEALRPSKAHLECRWAWRSFVKSAETIYEMVQATIVLEDIIKAEYLKNEWWYWSSLSAAVKTSTLSALALRIYSLDAAIIYEKTLRNMDLDHNMKPNSMSEPKSLPILDMPEKCKPNRRSNKKRKEMEG